MSKWYFEFEEDGGYDSMSAAYQIFDKLGNRRAVIDVRDYLDIEWGKWQESYDIRHSRHEIAEAHARLMVVAPELLRMLERFHKLLWFISEHPSDKKIFSWTEMILLKSHLDDAWKLIARAKGEE